MSYKRVEAVIFDMGNVVIRNNFKYSISELCKITGMGIFELLSILKNDKIYMEYETGMITTDEFLEKSCSFLNARGKAQIDCAALAQLFNSVFIGRGVSNELLYRIKSKCPIYLLSNTSPLHIKHICGNFDFLPIFDRLFLSYELKCRKPDTKIYENVLKQIKVKPDSVIFIDDSKENVASAREIGINGIVYTNEKKLIKTLEQMEVI